jgi:hypothetical protein
MRGFIDHQKDQITGSFTTATVDVATIGEDWETVPSLDRLVVQPILLMARQVSPPRIELPPVEDFRPAPKP